AGRAGSTGGVPARPRPSRVRVLAGLRRGAGARRLLGDPAAAGPPCRDPSATPGDGPAAGLGGPGRTGPEPGVVPGLRPAAGGRGGGRLRLLPAARRGLGGRLPTASDR